MKGRGAGRRLAVIGAGPMGLEAALGAVERGFEVSVYEAGRVAESLRQWGPTTWFTPLAMNLSERARTALGSRAPDPSALLTGPESAEEVFEPLAESETLIGRVHTETRVVGVSRRGLTRHDHAGHPVRFERPFRLLLETDGEQFEVEADVVLDASGVYGQPLPVGPGGPVAGEAKAEARIIRRIGDLHQARDGLSGERVVLVGDGHSAANALVAINQWQKEGAGPTRVDWLVRSRKKRPCVEVPDDPLPERMAITRQANDLAGAPPEWLQVLRGQTVRRLDLHGEVVRVETSRGEELFAERVVSLTGFRPDTEMLQELALDLAAATEGGGALWRAVSAITDCLSVPEVAAADLASGEPGFYLIGHKSYGRSNTFLLSTGRLQLETILDVC